MVGPPKGWATSWRPVASCRENDRFAPDPENVAGSGRKRGFFFSAENIFFTAERFMSFRTRHGPVSGNPVTLAVSVSANKLQI